MTTNTRYKHGATYYKALEIRKTNPCATLQTIADKLGVSRQRIEQILKTTDLPTKHYVRREQYQCLNCGTIFSKLAKSERSKKFCCKQCGYEYTHPQVECDYCHKLFRREQHDLYTRSMEHKHFFCSKTCQGKWLADNHGFKVHPENITTSPYFHIKKWDYDMVWAKHLETNYGALRLSRLLNIPEGTISAFLHKKRGLTGNTTTL